jgi:hypothetical protein
VFPLVQKPAMDAHARSISAALTRAGLANSIDTTGGFGGCTLQKCAPCMRTGSMACHLQER